jgi:hypothetical protein
MQTFGHCCGNLGDQVARCVGQHRIPPLGYPLRAKHCGFELIRCEHRRRHVEVAVKA